MTTDAPASPAGYEDALAYLRALVPMTDDAFDLLEEAMRSRAFTVAELANADMATQVLGAIESAIEKGTTFEKFVEDVGALLEDSWGGEKPGSLETIFRTNVQTAYNAGSYAQRTDPDVLEARPFWMFDDVPDDRQSDICAAIHGTVLPADDPFWDSHHPPLHFNALAQGTPILTSRGRVAIERVLPGDLVLTHRRRWRPVYAVMGKRPDVAKIRRLHLSTGRSLLVTDEHPVLCASGWKAAGDVQVGDEFFQARKHVPGARDVAGCDPQDYPTLFHEPSIAFDIVRLPRRPFMRLAVDLQRHHRRLVGEVENVVTGDMLHRERYAGLREQVAHDDFGRGGALTQRGSLSDAHPNARHGVVDRVRRLHTRGMSRIKQTIFFGHAEGPMLGAARSSNEMMTDADLLGLATNGNRKPPARTRERRLAEPHRALDSANRLTAIPVSILNQSTQLRFAQVDWIHAKVISIADELCNDLVWNLAVADDETYLADGLIVHNCRSQLVSLSPEEAEEMGVTAKPSRAQADGDFGAPPGADFDLDYSRFPDEIRSDVERKTTR